MSIVAIVAAGILASPALAQNEQAKQFGAREAVQDISLSPDGTKVAFIAPAPGQGTVVFVAPVSGGVAAKPVLSADGKPEQVQYCNWVTNDRLICSIHLVIDQAGIFFHFNRKISVGADGQDLKELSARSSDRALGLDQGGGYVLDYGADDKGSVLMTRNFVPEVTIGTNLANTREGVGVERVDARTLRRSVVEQPKPFVKGYISDGHGDVRVMGYYEVQTGYPTGTFNFFYRQPGNRDWKPLSTYDSLRDVGFNPLAVDRDLNVVYGTESSNGRIAMFRIKLDGSMARELVLSRPDVDVDSLIRIGRQQRVVGISYASERREAKFFDPQLESLAVALGKALPGLPLIRFVDASADESKLLLFAGSDKDAGRYYLFDKATKHLDELMLSRPQLEKVTLAEVKPIRFKAADGTEVPGYLTLPPGSSGKNLPAIVMPHGGPAARDEWGFDWLAQYYAARGYAVLQPNYRGSSGYGEDWFVENGFRSWKTAIGDINDGGRWLVSQGIADPKKLAIVGWSYGGYAALQSSVLDPDLFKAIVAIAPVTDLDALKTESRGYSNHRTTKDFIGTGDHIREGSPARNAERIKAPVLMFHGEMDSNVDAAESRLMRDKLKAAGASPELVSFPGLDHQLDDSAARTQMLDRSDAFLRKAMGIN